MFTGVRVRRAYSDGMGLSPYTMAQQVYSWQGRLWALEMSLKPLRHSVSTEGPAWLKFLLDLEGRQNTFNMDISSYVPATGVTGLTAVPFRLAEPLIEWDMNTLKHIGLTIQCMEAVGT